MRTSDRLPEECREEIRAEMMVLCDMRMRTPIWKVIDRAFMAGEIVHALRVLGDDGNVPK